MTARSSAVSTISCPRSTLGSARLRSPRICTMRIHPRRVTAPRATSTACIQISSAQPSAPLGVLDHFYPNILTAMIRSAATAIRARLWRRCGITTTPRISPPRTSTAIGPGSTCSSTISTRATNRSPPRTRCICRAIPMTTRASFTPSVSTRTSAGPSTSTRPRVCQATK